VNDLRDFTSGEWLRPSPTDHLAKTARNAAP
jgi:hypothetical protein